MKEIKYIGFYDIQEPVNKRVCSMPAINKMDYICEAINKAGYNVHIVSPSWFDSSVTEAGFTGSSVINLTKTKKLTLAPSFGTSNKITRNVKIGFSLLWMFFWLLKHVKKNEKILVYHVQWLSLPLRFARKIKRFQIILEVEEIYGEVWENNKTLQIWEQKLIKKADSFIAVSDVMSEYLGNKVKSIVYGNYSIPIETIKKKDNGFINVVYAGSIDSTKGGAYNSVLCARFLPENYKIHISGFGAKNDVIKLKQMIFKINKELFREAIIFHSEIPANHFSSFLKSSQIAINPQKDGENMNYLFPSKIIKYLSHNLRVVSTRIKSIDKSSISPLINFSENDTAESISEAILKIDLTEKYDSKKVIKELDIKFINDLKYILDTNYPECN